MAIFLNSFYFITNIVNDLTVSKKKKKSQYHHGSWNHLPGLSMSRSEVSPP